MISNIVRIAVISSTTSGVAAVMLWEFANYVIDRLHEAGISHCTAKLCDRYQFFAAMAFLSWFISTT
ncbi:transmembrane protein, putative [Medicago truncatula]|uniref:Transmembrane protein, putative n=1 Tax=Medicago truncatula TaxID=3880 RepID=G7K2C4_MEDTR|nr:transmembrane protein, putative [Medicago truncatula]